MKHNWQFAREETERRLYAQKLLDRETGRIRPVSRWVLAEEAYREAVETIAKIANEKEYS